MKGSTALRALIVAAAVIGSLADKPKRQFKKFPPQQRAGGQFAPPLRFPPVPPFDLAPVTPAPNSNGVLDPYACLPKYLCVIQNKKGEKRTTIVHGLHPALSKPKPNVIDPANLSKVTGPGKPAFPPPHVTETSPDDDVFRDREFDDSFLKQQEMAETMAMIEEKRRQFMYQQGLPKQVIIPKKTDDDESKEEAEEKSQEEEKEDEKSAEENTKEEEKEEPEEESTEAEADAEDDVSVEVAKSEGGKLSKYKIKKKAYSAQKMRNSAFKSRMDEYEEDADTSNDHLVTVPWDDRIRNDADPLKPKEIYDKLFGNVFQLSSLPKIAKSIPGMSFLTKDSDEEPTTTTTQRPGLLKRMFRWGSSSGDQPKQRNGKPIRRQRRDLAAQVRIKLIGNDEAIVKQIRDPARQCRMIYKGCDLPYDHIMKMVSSGQVLIENDNDGATTKKPAPTHPSQVHDDEAEQAIRDKMAPKKSSKPIQQFMAQQASLGGKKKVAGPAGLPIFGKNKKPIYDGSAEFSSAYQRPKPKKTVASLPLLPMRYHWGNPTYTQNGRPTFTNGPPDFSGGIMDPNTYKTPAPAPAKPTAPTTTTTERPLFAAAPLDKKDKNSVPFQHSIIKLNKTHAVHVLKKKPYNPPKTRTVDEKGRPVSFSTVFSEIAGNTGGIHDFFDRISGAFGGDGTRESGRELTSTFPGSNGEIVKRPQRLPYQYSASVKPTAFPHAPVPDHINRENGEDRSPERDDEEGSEEEEDEENNEEGEGENEGEEEEEDEEEEDIGDDIGDGPAQSESNLPQQKPQGQEPTLGPSALTIDSNEDPFTAPLNNRKPEKVNNKKKKPKPQEKPQEEEEEDDEEAEDDDEDEMDLPDNIPPFIRQSMIEEYKKKKLEKEKGGGDDEEQDDQGAPQQGGQAPGGPGAGGIGGRPGAPGAGGLGGRPKPGGFLSSLFGGGGGSQQPQGPPQGGGYGGRPGQGGSPYGAEPQGPPQGGGFGGRPGPGQGGSPYGGQQHGPPEGAEYGGRPGQGGSLYGSPQQGPPQSGGGGGGLFSFLG